MVEQGHDVDTDRTVTAAGPADDVRPRPCGPWRTGSSTAPDGILAHDDQGVIRFVNATASALLPNLRVGELLVGALDPRAVDPPTAARRPAPRTVRGRAHRGRSRLHARRHVLSDGWAAWYVDDVTEQHGRLDTLLAERVPLTVPRLGQREAGPVPAPRPDGEDGGRAGRRRAGAGGRGRVARRRRARTWSSGRPGNGPARCAPGAPDPGNCPHRWWPRCAVRRPTHRCCRTTWPTHRGRTPRRGLPPRPVRVVPGRRRPRRRGRVAPRQRRAGRRARPACGTPRRAAAVAPAVDTALVERVRPARGHRHGRRGALRPPGAHGGGAARQPAPAVAAAGAGPRPSAPRTGRRRGLLIGGDFYDVVRSLRCRHDLPARRRVRQGRRRRGRARVGCASRFSRSAGSRTTRCASWRCSTPR